MSAARQLMRYRTSVERPPSAIGEWNQPDPGDAELVASEVPCYAYSIAGRETIGPRSSFVVEDRRVLVPLETDVSELDSLGDVETISGRVIFSGPMRVEAVIRRPDHLSLFVSEVRS